MGCQVGGTTVASCLRKRELSHANSFQNYWCCDNLYDNENDSNLYTHMTRKHKKQRQTLKELSNDESQKQEALFAETGCRSGGTAYEVTNLFLVHTVYVCVQERHAFLNKFIFV